MSNREDKSFLGTGWSFPPTFTSGGDNVVLVADEEDIQQSLNILFSTNLTERLMHPNYGCELSSFLYEEITQGMLSRMRDTIANAVLYYEPRITLENLQITQPENELGLILISIEYLIVTTNSRGNMVYPFYINESFSYE